MVTSQAFGSLNPLCAAGSVDLNVLKYHTNLYLLTEDPETLEPMPWLAASLPEVEQDGKVWHWSLKPDAAWSDGHPLTSADVVETWRRLMAAEEIEAMVRSASRGSLIGVDAVEAEGEHGFLVRYREPRGYAMLDFGLGFAIAPAHLLPAADDDLVRLRELAGSGPYDVLRREPSRLVLKRKRPWWGDAHACFKDRYRIDEFVYELVQDEVQVREGLKRGSLDLAVVFGRDTYEHLLGQAEAAGLESARYNLAFTWSFIGWNCRHAPFDDVRVRRAMSLLIPRAAINARSYRNEALLVSSSLSGAAGYEDTTIPAPRYSPTEARSLLESAGWRDSDGDGRLDRDGKPFEFRLTIPVESRSFLDDALGQFRESAARIGIRIEVDALAQGLLRERAERGRLDAWGMVWRVDPLRPDVAELHRTGGSYNWGGYSNPDLDDELGEFRRSADRREGVEAAQAIQRALVDDQPWCWLFANPIWVVWRARVKDVHCWRLGIRQWDWTLED